MDQYNRGRLVEVRLKYFVSLTDFISRIITSDWGLADWVQRLIGTNRVCYASEKSMVDPKNRLMEMHSKNLTFNSYVNMEEKMTYTADPEDDTRTMLKQEMIVTVSDDQTIKVWISKQRQRRNKRSTFSHVCD